MREYKKNQKVKFSEAGLDFFCREFPNLRTHLSQDEGVVVDFSESRDRENAIPPTKYIHVKWKVLGDVYKALDWAIEPHHSSN